MECPFPLYVPLAEWRVLDRGMSKLMSRFQSPFSIPGEACPAKLQNVKPNCLVQCTAVFCSYIPIWLNSVRVSIEKDIKVNAVIHLQCQHLHDLKPHQSWDEGERELHGESWDHVTPRAHDFCNLGWACPLGGTHFCKSIQRRISEASSRSASVRHELLQVL